MEAIIVISVPAAVTAANILKGNGNKTPLQHQSMLSLPKLYSIHVGQRYSKAFFLTFYGQLK